MITMDHTARDFIRSTLERAKKEVLHLSHMVYYEYDGLCSEDDPEFIKEIDHAISLL